MLIATVSAPLIPIWLSRFTVLFPAPPAPTTSIFACDFRIISSNSLSISEVDFLERLSCSLSDSFNASFIKFTY